MTTVLGVMLVVFLFLLWLGALGACIAGGISQFDTAFPIALVYWFAGFLVLTIPIGLVINASDHDRNANRLCLQGHQEWVRRSTGKTTYLEKTWICEQWGGELVR